jgi:hypothetical protein
MFASALLALTLAPGAPSEGADSKKRAEVLVAQLGDKDYRDREKAAKELLEMGYAAKDAVLAGQKNADSEISERCRKLYPEIFRYDLEKRVQKFLDHPDDPIPDDLPGATKWLKIVGEGKESRTLYGEMVKAHPDPLLDVELHPERLKEVYVELMRTVYTRVNGRRPVGAPVQRPMPEDTEVLLFLFLGAAGDVRTNAPGVSSSYYYLFINSQFLASRLSEDQPLRKLFAGWLEKERYTIALRRGLDLAALHNVKECAPTALKIATDAATTPFIRSTALLGFAKLGSREHIKDLEPLLKDKMLIANVVVNGERGSVQMRDVALGAAVHLAGEKPADFGFERQPPNGINIVTTYTYFAFGTDEKREAAHAKWKEWAEKNLKK